MFARVVEAGSFTAAAKQLRVSKSWLSESVRALEDRLGVRLLDRSTRRVTPTEAGRAYYTHASKAIEEAQRAQARAQELQAEPKGRLRVAAPEAFSRLYIVPFLPPFFAENPALTVELVEGVPAENLIEAGLDLAIRITQPDDPNLIVRRIGRSQVMIVASPDYLARRGAPATPADLASHACMGFSPLHWRHEWRFTAKKRFMAVPISPILLTNSAESLRAAAVAGLGLTPMPNWAATDLIAGGEVVQVLEDWQAPEMGIFAVYPSNRLITPKVRRFVDYVARAFKAAGLDQ